MRFDVTPAALVLLVAACSTAPPDRIDALASGNGFDLSDPNAFVVGADDVQLVASADYAPPHRSPRAIALVDGTEFRSFTLDVDLMQTGREYGHRDLCLFFGFESAATYYYVHMATTPDPNAHNVFLVDGAPRRNLMEPQARGVDWGQEEWHHVRLVRDVDAGSIEVYFDDMQTPVLAAQDGSIEWGRIGFGSFDDTGRARNMVVSAFQSRPVERSGSPFPSPAPASDSD
ncbi:MAG: hypothetical protein AAGI22_28965 [Planctomycetota bacterium]